MLDLTQPAPEAYPQLTPGVTPRWRHRQESNLLHAVQEAASWTSTRNPKPHVERGPTWRRGAPTELRPLLEPPYLAGGLPSAHAVDVDYARAVYGVLTMLGTLTHQPDYKEGLPRLRQVHNDPDAPGSHLLASIRGARLGLVAGASTRRRPRWRPVESVELNLSGMESCPDLDSERARCDDRL